MSPRLLPVDLQAQLVPGSFAHALHHLVDQLDLFAFDAHYRNDERAALAHAPTMLLKAVLLAYSQGMVSSRSMERACRDNVLFIALTSDAKPHFTTIADFVSRSREAIASVFAQVLTAGSRRPDWSPDVRHRRREAALECFEFEGTRAEFLTQAQKMERAATTMLKRH